MASGRHGRRWQEAGGGQTPCACSELGRTLLALTELVLEAAPTRSDSSLKEGPYAGAFKSKAEVSQKLRDQAVKGLPF